MTDAADVIPDAYTAIRVGKKLILEKFGERLLATGEPYTAVLWDGFWNVRTGQPLPRGQRGGGTPWARLCPKTGEPLVIALSR